MHPIVNPDLMPRWDIVPQVLQERHYLLFLLDDLGRYLLDNDGLGLNGLLLWEIHIPDEDLILFPISLLLGYRTHLAI